MLDLHFEILEVIFGPVVGLDKDDDQLFLIHYNSYFITYEIPPGIHSNQDLSEVI